MRVVYGNVILGDEARGDLIETDHSFERNVDVTSLPDATAPAIYGRDNHRTEISFRITRTHASMAECSGYILDLGTALPVQALLRVTWGEGSGGGVTRYLAEAVTPGVRAKQIGCASTITLSFIGGRLVRKPPAGVTT